MGSMMDGLGMAKDSADRLERVEIELLRQTALLAEVSQNVTARDEYESYRMIRGSGTAVATPLGFTAYAELPRVQPGFLWIVKMVFAWGTNNSNGGAIVYLDQTTAQSAIMSIFGPAAVEFPDALNYGMTQVCEFVIPESRKPIVAIPCTAAGDTAMATLLVRELEVPEAKRSNVLRSHGN